MKVKVGITGQGGFLGYHLFHHLKVLKDEFELVEFNSVFFEDGRKLDEFVVKCDVIVHLAAVNRHKSEEDLYRINCTLTRTLVESLVRTKSRPHVLMSSSTQEDENNLYGESKRNSRHLLSTWAKSCGANFSGLLIPNVFGPFSRPFYNSVIATFSYQLLNGQHPRIDFDRKLDLIYVGDLLDEFVLLIRSSDNSHTLPIRAGITKKVSEILADLSSYNEKYIVRGEIPDLLSRYKVQLFNTFRSYLDVKSFYPRRLESHKDSRGEFVEVIRHGMSGQTSYSVTFQGITRGNHFHTRKIERFAVVKGTASIELRKVGTDEVFYFELDGSNPSYIDIPVWYVHNIKNIGNEDLITAFWTNELFDSKDTDTYFEIV